ncbi:MAG: hypothetical protein ACKVRP_01295 [Bacteroidota bacterium]
MLGGRDGIDGMIIVSEEGERRKLGDDVLLLLEKLLSVAQTLNSVEEMEYLRQIIARGSSASRQRRVFHEKQNLQAVVDLLIQEFKTDTPMWANS